MAGGAHVGALDDGTIWGWGCKISHFSNASARRQFGRNGASVAARRQPYGTRASAAKATRVVAFAIE